LADGYATLRESGLGKNQEKSAGNQRQEYMFLHETGMNFETNEAVKNKNQRLSLMR